MKSSQPVHFTVCFEFNNSAYMQLCASWSLLAYLSVSMHVCVVTCISSKLQESGPIIFRLVANLHFPKLPWWLQFRSTLKTNLTTQQRRLWLMKTILIPSKPESRLSNLELKDVGWDSTDRLVSKWLAEWLMRVACAHHNVWISYWEGKNMV